MNDISIGWLATMRAVHLAACVAAVAFLLFGQLYGGEVIATRRWAVRASLLLAAVTAIGWFALTAMDISGLPMMSAMHSGVLTETQFGKLWQLRAAIWLATAVASEFTVPLAAAFAGALLGSLAWSGHGQTGPLPGLHLTFDVIHLLACGLWPGGLLPLLLYWKTVDRRTLDRFSTFALLTVATLAMSGLVNSYCLLGSPSDLLDTPYGRLLLLKLLLFIVLIALGAANRLIFMRQQTLRRLRLSILTELIFATIIFALIGFLGMLAPPRSLARNVVSFDLKLDDQLCLKPPLRRPLPVRQFRRLNESKTC